MKSEKFDAVVRTMPRLRHTLPGQTFDLFKSEAINWLVMQPEIRQFVFDKAKELLIYDPNDGTWRGSL